MAKDLSASRPSAEQVDGKGIRLAVAVSEYHRDITARMLEHAERSASSSGARLTHVVRVPGVYDLPIAVAALLRRSDVDAVVTLGAVVQGSTDHDQVITYAVAQTLLHLSVAKGKPVTLGVTGPGQTRAQAKARIDRAGHAVQAALRLVHTLRGF